MYNMNEEASCQLSYIKPRQLSCGCCIVYEIVNFLSSLFTLLLLLSFFLYLKSVPIHVIVHVYIPAVSLCVQQYMLQSVQFLGEKIRAVPTYARVLMRFKVN